MLITIDRFEGDFAVCELEDGSMSDIPISLVPDGAKEGSKLEYDGATCKLVDNTRSQERIKRKMDSLFR